MLFFYAVLLGSTIAGRDTIVVNILKMIVSIFLFTSLYPNITTWAATKKAGVLIARVFGFQLFLIVAG